MGRESGATSPAVKAVRGRIERWRRTRRIGAPMPAELWKAAVSLARDKGVYPIARGLRVDYGALKKRVAGSQVTDTEVAGCIAPAAFIELPATSLSSRTAAPGVEMELVDTDGSRLSLRLAVSEDLDLPGLVTAFRRRSL